MIITFVGTNKGNNSAKKAAAAVGGMLSLSNNKKVCIIQITNDSVGVEKLYRGKAYAEEHLGMKQFGLDENGIDGMIRKANAMKLINEHYYTACECMLRSDNRLDILGTSNQKTFIENIHADGRIDSIKRIIANADKIYNFVLVVLPNQEQVVESFISVSDINVCCVRQSDMEDPYLTDKKNVIVVTNFDPESIYTVKNIAKEYHKEDPKAKVFPMYYNTQFRDACHAQSLLTWLVKNYSVNTTDINYDFISKLQELTDFVSDTEAEYTPEPTPHRKAKKKAKEKHVKVSPWIKHKKEETADISKENEISDAENNLTES